MANTPQAKKRIRRNANRATINHARISRIRTFIKAVELAVASGNKDEAADRAAQRAAGNRPRRFARRHPPQHRVAQILAPDQAGRRARLKLRRFETKFAGCRTLRRPVFLCHFKKARNLRDSQS